MVQQSGGEELQYCIRGGATYLVRQDEEGQKWKDY